MFPYFWPCLWKWYETLQTTASKPPDGMLTAVKERDDQLFLMSVVI